MGKNWDIKRMKIGYFRAVRPKMAILEGEWTLTALNNDNDDNQILFAFKNENIQKKLLH